MGESKHLVRLWPHAHMDWSVLTVVAVAEIGIGLTAFGVLFTFLGIMFFFDRGFLAMGNVSVSTG